MIYIVTMQHIWSFQKEKYGPVKLLLDGIRQSQETIIEFKQYLGQEDNKNQDRWEVNNKNIYI